MIHHQDRYNQKLTQTIIQTIFRFCPEDALSIFGPPL